MRKLASPYSKAVRVIVLFHLFPLALSAQEEPVSASRDSTFNTFYRSKPLPGFSDFETGMYHSGVSDFLEPNINPAISKEIWKAPSYKYEEYKPSQVPFFKGDYTASALIYKSRYGALAGYGRQETLPGIAVFNNANLGYQHQWTDRISTSIQVNAARYGTYRFDPVYSLGVSAMSTYKIQNKMSFSAFAAYSISNSYNTSIYGGFFSFDISERFGVDAGVERYYDPFRMKWETVPIVRPYYKLNGKTKIGIDFGGKIKEVVRRW